MEIKDIRLANVLKIQSKYRWKQEFCTAAGISPSYFSQLKSGTKTLGDHLAREIEEKLVLPRGRLDVPHQDREFAGTSPPDVMTVAYAIESLPARVRDRIKALVLELAAEQSNNQPLPQTFYCKFNDSEDCQVPETGQKSSPGK